MKFSSLAKLLPALLALPTDAYFILSHGNLETTRLDPIVSPGGVSSHVHTIIGGSNFDKTIDVAKMRNGTCTTAAVSVDKSNYWVPQLYYYKPDDQTYEAIPLIFANTYYLPRAGSDGVVKAFPDGLRMLSGDPNRRTFNASIPSNAAISYVCLDYYTDHTGDSAWAQRNSFFQHNCPQGMRAQVNFPPCWDGVNLDSSDHSSHMAWPSGGVDGGDCPASHPVHLVSLFYEFIFEVQSFPYNNGSEPTWVWANGDTTGYGFHGDFVNGWPALVNGTNVLQQAIDGCNADNGVGGELDKCPPFVPYLDSASAGACRPQNALVDEDVGLGHYISKLPGNNPLWIGNGTKPSYANYTEGNTTYTTFKSVIPAGYTDVGCIAEATSGRALTGPSFANDNMTRGACVSFCESYGMPLAGVEYGRECYCDVTMRHGASNTTLLDSDRCGMACANDTYENCGGSSTLELFNNPSLYPTTTLPAGWSAYGCRTEATSGRALTGYSFTSSSMTNELCLETCGAKGYVYAGTEYSEECYCGNAFAAGSIPAADDCSAHCAGDDAETCGGSNRLSTFVYTNTSTTSTAASASSTSSVKGVSASASSTSGGPGASSTRSASSTSSKTASASASASSAALKVASSAAASKTTSVSSKPKASTSTSTSASSMKVSTSATLSSFKTSISTTASSSAKSSASTAKTSTSTTTAKTSISTAKTSISTTKSSISTVKTSASTTTSSSAKTSTSTGKTSTTSSTAKTTSTGKTSTSTGKTSTSTVMSSSTKKSASTTASSSAKTSTLTTASVSASASAVVRASVPGWSYVGCQTELSSGRALPSYSFTSSSMTQELCIKTCASQGYTMAGVQYASECYCGNILASASTVAAESDCKMACSGNSSEVCGGSARLSIFHSAPEVVTLPSGWAAYGCIVDSSPRTLASYSITSASNMTYANCLNACSSKGYGYAGLEYSSECYCANSIGAAGVNATAGDCNMACSGDKGSNCGGSNRLTTFFNHAILEARQGSVSSSASKSTATSSSTTKASSSSMRSPATTTSIATATAGRRSRG